VRSCSRQSAPSGATSGLVLFRHPDRRLWGLPVSPVYAHASCWVTKRVIIGARWLLTGPAVPFQNTTPGRAAHPRDLRHRRSSIAYEPGAYLGPTGATGAERAAGTAVVSVTRSLAANRAALALPPTHRAAVASSPA